jgi:hypothetical protein
MLRGSDKYKLLDNSKPIKIIVIAKEYNYAYCWMYVKRTFQGYFCLKLPKFHNPLVN